MACEMGVAGLMAIWNKLTPAQKKQLESHKNMCKEAAEEYERQAEQAEQEPADELKKRQQQGGQTKMELP